MIQDFRSFFTSFVINNTKGEITLVSDVDSETIKLFKNIDMNVNVYSDPVLIRDEEANKERYHPVDGSFLIPQDESVVLYRLSNMWEKIYTKDNEDGYFTIPYYINDKVYEQNEIVSYQMSFYVTVENNAVGVPPSSIITNDGINNNNISSVITDIVNPKTISFYENRIYIGTDNEIYSVNMVQEDTTLEIGNGGDFQHVVFFGNIITPFGNTAHIQNEDFLYTFDGAIRMIFADEDYIYVITENSNTIGMYEYGNNSPYKLIPFQEPQDSSFYISGSRYNDNIILTSYGSNEIVSIDYNTFAPSIETMSGISNMLSSTIIGEEIFMVRDDLVIYRIPFIESKWRKISVNELFYNNSCDNFYVRNISFDNVILNSSRDLVDFIPSAFTLYKNKYIFVSSSDYTGTVVRLDATNGAMNTAYNDGDFLMINSDAITGMTTFKDRLYISQGNEIKYLIEVDIETLDVLGQVDFTNVISGTNIQDISSLGDTLYILSNNGVLYGFSDIHDQPTSSVAFEEFTYYSKMVIIGNDSAYLTNHRPDIQTIALMDTVNGSLIESSMGIDINRDILLDFSSNSLFTLDVANNATISQYRRTFVKKLIG